MYSTNIKYQMHENLVQTVCTPAIDNGHFYITLAYHALFIHVSNLQMQLEYHFPECDNHNATEKSRSTSCILLQIGESCTTFRPLSVAWRRLLLEDSKRSAMYIPVAGTCHFQTALSLCSADSHVCLTDLAPNGLSEACSDPW